MEIIYSPENYGRKINVNCCDMAEMSIVRL